MQTPFPPYMMRITHDATQHAQHRSVVAAVPAFALEMGRRVCCCLGRKKHNVFVCLGATARLPSSVPAYPGGPSRHSCRCGFPREVLKPPRVRPDAFCFFVLLIEFEFYCMLPFVFGRAVDQDRL